MDLVKAYQEIDNYVKPLTPPLAVKMVKPGEPLPEKVRVPSRDFKKRFAICQAFSVARRYGWAVALGVEDQSCPIGSVVLGFREAVPFYTEGNLCEGMYTASKEAGARSEAAVRRFELHQYVYLLAAPLNRTGFEPDFVLVYANPAQVMRLVHAALYRNGGSLVSSFSGRAECSETIVNTMATGECQVVLPGNGERVFGHTQDWELAFTIPAARVEEVLEGLAATHKAGVRYPIPGFLNFEGVFPPKYQELEKIWKEQK